MDSKSQTIKLKINDDQLKGSYANAMRVFHQKDSFVIDFAHLAPPQGIVAARIITSPSRLKEMISALQENLRHYEEKFGEIKVEEDKKQEIGFQIDQ